MRKVMIVAAGALLMVMAMAADPTSGGTGAGIAVDPASGAVSFGGTLQEPVMDTVPDFQREVRIHHHRPPKLRQGS